MLSGHLDSRKHSRWEEAISISLQQLAEIFGSIYQTRVDLVKHATYDESVFFISNHVFSSTRSRNVTS